MKTIDVIYYKIKNAIKFNDGYEIKSGEKVMLISKDDNDMCNVLKEDDDSKRIFWVDESNLQNKKVQTERWSKSRVEQHEIDVNEKWLEHEQRTAKQTKIRIKQDGDNKGKKENSSSIIGTRKTGTRKKTASSRSTGTRIAKSKTQIRKKTKSAKAVR